MRKRILHKCLSVVLLTALIGCFIGGGGESDALAAAEKTLTLNMAKTNGLANSPEYEKLESELNVKEVSLKQAIKSIKIKKKNMATFRWTPLLSFKFPEKPDLTESFEFEYKPVEIQAEIDTIKHKMTDQVLAVYEKVSVLYVDIVVLQDTITLSQNRLNTMETALKKNRAKLLIGQAAQSDIETMEKSIEALKTKITLSTRNLAAKKKKLSSVIGIDITTGYKFEDPMVNASITRSQLNDLIQYTLDRDENYYEVSMDATTSRIALQTNYNLMSGQYGSNMGYISDFINQALSGQKVNGKAFKQRYEEFLTAVDKPWQGKKRILFIKIPKEWFKGQISGIRYVEDEPYALYEAALEYQDALLEKKNAKQELKESVEDSYNNFISLQNAYTSLVREAGTAEKQTKADSIRNRLGEMTYEEYKESLDETEDLQNQMYEALAEYSKALYSFDRLTCGGITALLEKTGADISGASGGESFVEEEYADGAYYYIESIIQEQEFRLGVSIPDDFDVDVTHFELWCDQIRIGDRTEIDKSIRHLALSVDNVSEVKIRFYNNDQFVDDCVIDSSAASGPLEIVKGYGTTKNQSMEIGSYTRENNEVTGMVTLTLSPKSEEKIGYYLIKDGEGNCLVSSALIPIQKKFKYISLLQDSTDQLTIEFYGEDSKLKYTGYFDTGNMKLMKNPGDA